MFPNTSTLILFAVLCLLAPVFLFMTLPLENAKKKLEQDLWGLAFVVVGLALIAVGYFSQTAYVLAFGALGLFLISYGILVMLPEGLTEWLLNKKNIGYLAVGYGVVNVFQNIFSPVSVPWNRFVSAFNDAYDILSITVDRHWIIFTRNVKWEQMTPALYGLVAIVLGLIWIQIYKRYFK